MSEYDPHKAIDYIRDNSKLYAKAKSERVYLEQFRKSKKAILIQQSGDEYKTIQAKESFAYSHPDYIELLEGLRIAVEEEEKLRWMIASAQSRIDVWRTQEASNRFADNQHRD